VTETESLQVLPPESRLDFMLYPALRATYFEEQWQLAAQGEPYLSCGQVRAKAWCPDCLDYKHDLLDHCDRPECPVCNLTWARRGAMRITERMWSYRKILKKHGKRHARLSHVSFSVPVEESHRDYRELRKELYKVMKKAGVRGAEVTFHPYRFRDCFGNEVPWKRCSLNPEAESPIPSVAVWSPHWHVICTGWLIPSDEFEARTGWIYKKHGELYTRDDVFSCAAYLLTHMGLHASMQSITYMGEASYSRLVIAEERVDYEPVLCPDCEAELELHYVKAKVIDGLPVLGWVEPWHRKVVKRRYMLKGVGS
jgi:hypothetical protein